MPPKKKDDAPAEKPIIGRFKSNLKVGAAEGREGGPRGGESVTAPIGV